MTDADTKALAEFQSSPEGNIERAVHDLVTALDTIERASRTRDGARFLRQQFNVLSLAGGGFRKITANLSQGTPNIMAAG